MKKAITVFDGQVAPWTFAEEVVIVDHDKIIAHFKSTHPYDDVVRIKEAGAKKVVAPKIGASIKIVLEKYGLEWEPAPMGADVFEIIRK